MHAAAISPQSLLAPQPTTAQPIAPQAPTRRTAAPGLSRLRNIIRQSKRHGLWIFAWSIVGWLGTALAPVLMDTPFILMLLSPRALFVALASDSVSLVPFVLLGTLRLSVTDASYYIIGRKVPNEIGECSTAPTTRWKKLIHNVTSKGDRLCRWFFTRPRLTAAFLFFRPNGKYLGIAGAYGVNRWTAALSATLGTAVFLTAMHIGLGAIF